MVHIRCTIGSPSLRLPSIPSLDKELWRKGKKTMHKQTIASQTGSSNALNTGQFQPSSNPTPRRSLWRVIAPTAGVLLAVMTIVAWMLLPRLTQPSAPAGQRKATPTTAPATPMPGLTQQYTFTAQDSGKTIRYGITTRFSLRLHQQHYPPQKLQLSCSPQGALGTITNVPSAAPPFYTVAYQANEAGICTLKNGNFILTVVIVQSS